MIEKERDKDKGKETETLYGIPVEPNSNPRPTVGERDKYFLEGERESVCVCERERR